MHALAPGPRLCASGEELPSAVIAHPGLNETSAPHQIREFLVCVEVPVAREWLRGGRGTAQLRSGGVDREAPTRAQHALTLAKRADRIVKEDEDDGHSESGERLVGERQSLSLRLYHARPRCAIPCEFHHLVAVVEPRHTCARGEGLAQKEPSSASDLEKVGRPPRAPACRGRR